MFFQRTNTRGNKGLTKMTTQVKDPDVEALYNFAMTMNMTPQQYGILYKIVKNTIKHKLKEASEQFMKLTLEEFKSEQEEMKKEKAEAKGVWS
jgi:hypothetical protein